jgi:hypothetical protein
MGNSSRPAKGGAEKRGIVAPAARPDKRAIRLAAPVREFADCQGIFIVGGMT